MKTNYWTPADDEIACRDDIGIATKAVLLRRSYDAVVTRRGILRSRGRDVPRVHVEARPPIVVEHRTPTGKTSTVPWRWLRIRLRARRFARIREDYDIDIWLATMWADT